MSSCALSTYFVGDGIRRQNGRNIVDCKPYTIIRPNRDKPFVAVRADNSIGFTVNYISTILSTYPISNEIC